MAGADTSSPGGTGAFDHASLLDGAMAKSAAETAGPGGVCDPWVERGDGRDGLNTHTGQQNKENNGSDYSTSDTLA